MTKIAYYAAIIQRLDGAEFRIDMESLIIDSSQVSHDEFSPIKWLEKEQNTIPYKFNEFIFRIYQVDDATRLTYCIKNDDPTDFFHLTIFVDLNSDHAHIGNISNFPDCTLNGNGMAKPKGRSLMLRLALDFIRKKLNLKYVTLQDDSFYFCEALGENIEFDSLHMLTQGSTWYGSIGFLPFSEIEKRP